MSWPTLVTAVAAAIGSMAAILAVVVDGRRTRRQLGIENMWRLIDRWDSLDKTRSAAANHLLVNWAQRDELSNEAAVLLDSFELLAYLVVRSKTLSLEDTWVNFSGSAIMWWHCCEPGIRKMQRSDATIYEDYSRLAELLMEEEAKRRHKNRNELLPSEGDLKQFLSGARMPAQGQVLAQDQDSGNLTG